MSTDGGGKVKNKRTHTNPKPYDRRKSFFDKIRGFLGPSWIPSFRKTEHNEGDESDPERPLRAAEDRHLQRPPDNLHVSSQQLPSSMFQRDHSQSQTMTNSYKPPPPDLSKRQSNHVPPATYTTSAEAPTATFTSAELPFSSYTKMLLGKESIHEDNQSMHSDNSTSGCSSMIPHPDKREYQKEILQMNETSIQKFKEHSPKKMESFQEQTIFKRKPLEVQVSEPPSRAKEFSASYFQPQSIPLTNKPSFNASLFGSPFGSDTSLLGDNLNESSFYQGRTQYGGASSSRKRSKLNVTAPYQTALPIRKQVKAKPLNNSFNTVTSSTARRILETLERMSSPLTDAKKIPASDSLISDASSFNPTSYRKSTRYNIGGSASSSFKEFQSRGPPVNKIMTPSVASIATNRQVINPLRDKNVSVPEKQTSQMDTSSPSISHDASLSALRKSDTEILPEAASSGRKMKRDKSYQHRPPAHRVDEECVELPNLKTDFTLPSSSIPKFDFGKTAPLDVKKSSSKITNVNFGSTPSKSNSSFRNSKEENRPAMQFTFSSPIHNPPPSPSVERSSPGSKDFTFSSPLKIDSPSCDISPKSLTRPPLHKTDDMDFKFTSHINNKGSSKDGSTDTVNSRNTNLLDLLGKKNDNGSDNSDSIKPASELKKGSVLDILGKLDKISNTEHSVVKPSPVLKSGSVKEVLNKLETSDKTKNNQRKLNMAAPEENKASPEMKAFPKESKNTSEDLWSKLGKPDGKWECSTCLVQNKNDNSKCVACQTEKPGSSSTSSTMVNKSNDLWSSMSQPTGWSCSVCLIQNKKEDAKCVACQTPNPKSSDATTAKPASKSNDLWASISKQSGWSCSVCLLQNKNEDSKCVACQTPNSSKTGNLKQSESAPLMKLKKPAGNWECDTCLVQNKGDATKCCACETPKPGSQPAAGGLKFQPGAFTASSSFSFAGSSNKDIAVSSDVKFGFSASDTTPGGGVTLGFSNTPSSQAESSGGFKFGAPVNSTDSDNGESRLTEGSIPEKATETTKSDSNSNFKFGIQATSQLSTLTDIAKSAEHKPIPGGFNFSAPSSDLISGQNKSVDSVTETKTDSSVNQLTKPSEGFVFGSVSEKPTLDSGIKFTETSKPNNLFSNFSSSSASFGVNTTTVTQPVQTNNVTGFTFQANSPVVKPLGTGSISSFQSAGSDKQAGFTFKPPEKSETNSSVPLKRNRDDETGSSDAKKPTFGILGSGNVSEPVGFSNIQSSIPSVTTPSGFSFGAVAGTTVTSIFPTSVSSSSASTSSFSFNASTVAASTSNSTVQQNAFQFGTSSSTSSQPLFTFGQSAAKTTTSSAVFQFGASAPATSTNASTSNASTNPNFQLTGSNQTSAAPTLQFGSSNTTAFGNTGFAFNQQPSVSTTPAVFGSSQITMPSNTTPTFGSKQTTQPSNVTPLFGSSQTTQPSNATPVFGSSTVSTSSTPSFGNPGSTFGSATPFGMSRSSTVPVFGSSSSAPFGQASSAQTGFNQAAPSFGGTTSNGPVFQFGSKPAEPAGMNAVAPQAPSSGFSFGQTASPAAPAPAANATGGFNFSATPSLNFSSTTSSNPQAGGIGTFNFGATPSSDGRKIKKAIRKINRK